MALLPDYTEIMDLIKKGLTLEAQEKIMQLREGALQLQEENLELRKRVRDLEEHHEFKKHLRWDGRVYWYENPESGASEGPYCQRCWDGDAKAVRLHRTSSAYSGSQLWHCHVCKGKYYDCD